MRFLREYSLFFSPALYIEKIFFLICRVLEQNT